MEMKFRQYAGRWEILNIPEGYLCTFGFSKKKKEKDITNIVFRTSEFAVL